MRCKLFGRFVQKTIFFDSIHLARFDKLKCGKDGKFFQKTSTNEKKKILQKKKIPVPS
jgi:hypothetical protein